jgi:hypothetical protein
LRCLTEPPQKSRAVVASKRKVIRIGRNRRKKNGRADFPLTRARRSNEGQPSFMFI